jgi:hypothetical protein
MSNDERMKVMKLVQDGKISPEEGMELIDLLESRDKTGKVDPTVEHGPKEQAKWVRIRVTDLDTGRQSVNVRLPLGLVNAGAKLGAKFTPEVEGIDLTEILKAAREGGMGNILEVEDDNDHERVEIFLE